MAIQQTTYYASLLTPESSIAGSSTRGAQGLASTSFNAAVRLRRSYHSHGESVGSLSDFVPIGVPGSREIARHLLDSTKAKPSGISCTRFSPSSQSEADFYTSHGREGRSGTTRISCTLDNSFLSSPQGGLGRKWETLVHQGMWKKKIVCRASERNGVGSLEWMSKASPYEVLGVSADSSEEDIKAAFRARIKEYHPDVYQGLADADAITQRLLRAYEILIASSEQTTVKRKNLDPFEEPECVAEDVFVNELACIGRGCPYSCVERAPDVFQFAYDTGCARAVSQGQAGEYHVQLAVGQCPRNCIHYLTPEQRCLVEEILGRALEGTFYSSESIAMDGLLARAKFENGRFQSPKRRPKRSEKWVDWY